jgi:hypothetical protein
MQAVSLEWLHPLPLKHQPLYKDLVTQVLELGFFS